MLGSSIAQFQDWLPPLAIAVASFFLLRRAYRRPKKAQHSVPQRSRHANLPGDPASSVASGAGSPASLDQWEVRLHDVGREWTAVMDSKIVILRQLLDEIDARIAHLESLRGENPPAQQSVAGAPAGPSQASSADPNDPRTIATELLDRIAQHDQGSFPESLVESP